MLSLGYHGNFVKEVLLYIGNWPVKSCGNVYTLHHSYPMVTSWNPILEFVIDHSSNNHLIETTRVSFMHLNHSKQDIHTVCRFPGDEGGVCVDQRGYAGSGDRGELCQCC